MSVTRQPVTESAPPAGNPAPSAPCPLRRWLGRLLSLALAAGVVVGVVALGHAHGWRMPKFSALMGWAAEAPDDWCKEHGVPESICVQCREAREGTEPHRYGWCKKHGVHECPFCHPEVAQLPGPPPLAGLLANFAAAEAAGGDYQANASKCRMHLARIQFASAEAVRIAGVRVESVGTGPVVEAVRAPGEVVHDPTAVARLSARLPGAVWRVEKQQGDRVKAGEVLALVDAPGVGRAKAELVQALLRVEAETKSLAALRAIADSVPERRIREAQAALDEATILRAAAEQALGNLGLAVDAQALAGLSPAEAGRKLQFAGLPPALAAALDTKTAPAGLLPVVAPAGGVVLRRDTAAGEAVDAGKVLFVLAEPERLWLLLRVGQEDVGRLRPGLAVRFDADSGATGSGKVGWIGTAIDEKSRTVPVRVAVERVEGGLRAGLYGTGLVVLREAAAAVVVPSTAVHWEGCCHVAFVRDKDYAGPEAPKVFHVRKVQPGVAETGRTEVLAGLLPGEVVATEGSGLLRSELLRNNLGAG